MTGEELIKEFYHRAQVLEEVSDERDRQNQLWGEQNWPNGTGGYQYNMAAHLLKQEYEEAAKAGSLTFRHILAEEVAEAFAESDPAKLRTELIQCAAVCVAWACAIDRGKQP